MQLFMTIEKLLTFVAKEFIINVEGSILCIVGTLSYLKRSYLPQKLKLCKPNCYQKEISLRCGKVTESDKHSTTIY